MLARLIRLLKTRSGTSEPEAHTPRNFIAGYIPVPPGEKHLRDATWHAAAVALDTESLRLISQRGPEGIYYLAAPAAAFASHPNAHSVLGSAMPGREGHSGAGVYCSDLGAGLIAVVRFSEQHLESYIGEQSDIERFAGRDTLYWPKVTHPWESLRELDSRAAQRFVRRFVIIMLLLSTLFSGVGIASRMMAARLQQKAEAVRTAIVAAQMEVAGQFLASSEANPFLRYRQISKEILSREGTLRYFEATPQQVSYQAEVPAWVSDFGSLGDARKESMEGGALLKLTKGNVRR